MKKFSLPLVLLFIVGFGVQAQKRSGLLNPEYSKIKAHNEKIRAAENRSAYSIDRTTPSLIKMDHLLQIPDTLNFPLPGEYALYTFSGGYVSGNNSYGDLAKANIFEYGSNSMLTGVLIDFAVATQGSAMVEIAAWNNSGSNTPGNKIASTQIPLNTIFQDIQDDVTTYIPFDSPVLLPPTFYVGVLLPEGAADTVAIFTNTDGDTQPATAWEQWNTNQWFRYDDEDSWGYDLAHAIFPIVDSEIGLSANFFASETQVLPGSSISFFDISVGDPVTWNWMFEGGQPTTSDEENPFVTYAEEGLYDVSLIVGNGETFDSLTRTEYILVTLDIPVETDTLNFPLPGVKTLYTITPNGGYVCGTNVFNDLAKANYFNNTDNLNITGILVDFAVAKGGNPNIEIGVWNNNGDNGDPGSTLATETVSLNTIKSNISNSMMTYVAFDPPVQINHPFYAGFMLPLAAEDTLAVYSNEDGDTNPGTAWDWWESGDWVPISDPSSWILNISMAIHPIVEYQTGIEDKQAISLNVFPNPTKGRITLDLTAFNEDPEVSLYNINGQKIRNISMQRDQLNQTLDLSGYTKGIYFLRISDSEKTGNQKIIYR